MSEDRQLETLQTMHDVIEQSPKDVEAAKLNENGPIKDVEKSLSAFTQETFKIVNREYDFQEDIEQEIRSRLSLEEKDGGFTNKELLALHDNNQVNLNDRISKLMGPTFGLITAKQQNEMAQNATASKNEININTGGSQDQMKQLNQTADQSVLQGMAQLQNFINAISAKANAETVTPEKK